MRAKPLAIALAVVVASYVTACVQAQETNAHTDVRKFVEHFVHTVNEADVDGFVACFTTDATAFFPSAANALRRVGAADIRAAVAPTFARGRPAMPVEPREVMIQVGDQIALVTFVFGSNKAVARRTLVLTHVSDEWKIMHLHASNVSP